jgi:hypothetical protein
VDYRTGTIATGTQHRYNTANYHVWRAPGGFSIRLGSQLVRELAGQIGASGESCGILLGHSITAPFAATMADDFVVIPPSEDFESVRQTAEKDGRELRAIGYFRLQRDGALTLDARDAQSFNRWFCENGNVVLLIRVPRRGDSEAALFYWEDGHPQPREFRFGFSLNAMKLAGGHPGGWFPGTLEPEQEAPAGSAFRWTPKALLAAPSGGIRWSRLLPTVAIAILGVGAIQMASDSKATVSAAPAPASEAAAASTATAYETPLGLKVTSQPHQLEIRWNRRASAVTSAAQGTMSISEAGVTEAVPFDARELQEGYVAYTPKTNDVSIRLEVTAADGAATAESIRVVAIP